MASPAPAFPPKAIAFFRQLAAHNDRDWFAAHKPVFDEHVMSPMLALVTHLGDGLAKFAPEFVPEDPRKSIYRIYRDTRFSKDKTPYKTHIAAHFQHRRVTRNQGAGYYFSVSHTGVEVAGGIWMPGPDELPAIREAFVRREKEIRRIIADAKLKKALGTPDGERFARVPKGFDPDSPAADLLRLKRLGCYKVLPPKLATSADLAKQILARFKLLAPLVDFLTDAILKAQKQQPDDRPKRPEPMF